MRRVLKLSMIPAVFVMWAGYVVYVVGTMP